MTSPDPDVFAYNEHANQLRRDKAKKVAKYLYEQGTSVATALFLDEDAQKAAEKAVGVRTSHRPDLWAIVLDLLEQRYDWDVQHPPQPADTTVPDPVDDVPAYKDCGCPTAGVTADDRKHRAFHDLVEEQTGIAYGQPLNIESLRAARGRR